MNMKKSRFFRDGAPIGRIGAGQWEVQRFIYRYSNTNHTKGKRIRRTGENETKTPPIDLIFEPDETNVVHRCQDAFTPRDPIRHIVDGVIRKHSVNLWYGRYGSRKTKSALDLGARVAEGDPWIGYRTVKTNVLYIDTENGIDETMDNIQDVVRGEYLGKSINLFYISLADLNLHKRPELDARTLIDRIKRVHAGLIIIDPLRGIMFGGDVKSDTDTDAVFALLRWVIDETGTTVLCIHNANRNDEFFGSISIPGAVASMVHIRSQKDSPLVKFEFQKLRRGQPENFTAKTWFEGKEPFTSFRMTVPDSIEISIDLGNSGLDNVDGFVMSYLAESGPTPSTTVNSAYKQSHAGKGKPGNSFTKLKRNGYIVQPLDKKGSDYELTEQGKAWIANYQKSYPNSPTP